MLSFKEFKIGKQGSFHLRWVTDNEWFCWQIESGLHVVFLPGSLPCALMLRANPQTTRASCLLQAGGSCLGNALRDPATTHRRGLSLLQLPASGTEAITVRQAMVTSSLSRFRVS